MAQSTTNLSPKPLTYLFKNVLTELEKEPKFTRTGKPPFATEKDGTAAVKVAVGNVPLTYDLWKGLKNPAVVGLYPAGLPEIWEFYAHRKKTGIDESGRSTIFQVPHTFDYALSNYTRAVLISAMLPFSPHIIDEYTRIIYSKAEGSSHVFAAMYEKVNSLLDKAITRVAIDLVTGANVVVPLNNTNVNHLSTEAVSLTRQGISHGPSKGGNFPQKSLAALLGLGQIGVHRILFRDEVIGGGVQRFVGPLRSIIIFDDQPLHTTHGVIHISEQWRRFLFDLFDFLNDDPAINKFRFCSYIPHQDEGCGLCIKYCPSGAQANSVPLTTGEYSPEVRQQTHRFWEGKLQFDYARCCEKRGQMAALYPEWSCARGLSVCAAKGRRRMYAAQNFYSQREALTSEFD